MFAMRNKKEDYITGRPIKTEWGTVRFLKIYEYLDHSDAITLITLNNLHIYYRYKQLFKNEKDPNVLSAVEELKELSLYEIVMGLDVFYHAYEEIYRLILDHEDNDVDDSLASIFSDEKSFMDFRQLFMDMNMLKEEAVSPNPEIQKAIERSIRVKMKTKEKQTISDILSSIVVGTGIDYETINNWTVLQVYATYYRLDQFKSYDATTLFATVAEDVSIEHWGKHIDLYKTDSHAIEKDKFVQQFQGMVK